jgi:hypothetical protein
MFKINWKKAAWAVGAAVASFVMLKWMLGNLLDASIVDGIAAIGLGLLVYFRVSEKDVNKAVADVKGAVEDIQKKL